MRVFGIFSLWILLSFAIDAQTPQGLNYQAVARNMDGSIVSAQSVSVRFSILDASTTGAAVYQEKHQTNTNNFGLFTLAIGRGSVVSGSFAGINWGAGSKFLKVEIAVGGGGYQLQGTTQLLSVPYALYAEKSGNGGTPGPIGAQGPAGAQGPIGPAGATGATGPQGAAGAKGPQGPVGLTGAVGPQGVVGPAGPAGATGPQGATGATGPAAPIGLTGAVGSAGPQGANGKTILNGASNPPSTVGLNGDFFLNTTTSLFFGPKTTAGWGTGVSLIGPAGGPPGLKSLIDLKNFSANATCSSGGVTVSSGVDQNNNNVLDANEVDNTKDVCFTQKAQLDKVVIIPLTYANYSASSSHVRPAIIKFNKNDYPEVDSIILVANPYVTNSTNTGTVQLYNITDNIPIANSSISTNKVYNISDKVPYTQSGNAYESLPNHTIALGIYMGTAIAESGVVVLAPCYLYLYRR